MIKIWILLHIRTTTYVQLYNILGRSCILLSSDAEKCIAIYDVVCGVWNNFVFDYHQQKMEVVYVALLTTQLGAASQQHCQRIECKTKWWNSAHPRKECYIQNNNNQNVHIHMS